LLILCVRNGLTALFLFKMGRVIRTQRKVCHSTACLPCTMRAHTHQHALARTRTHTSTHPAPPPQHRRRRCVHAPAGAGLRLHGAHHPPQGRGQAPRAGQCGAQPLHQGRGHGHHPRLGARRAAGTGKGNRVVQGGGQARGRAWQPPCVRACMRACLHARAPTPLPPPLFVPQVTFRDPYRYRHQKELFVAAEGLYTGQVSGWAGRRTASPACTCLAAHVHTHTHAQHATRMGAHPPTRATTHTHTPARSSCTAARRPP